MSRRRIGLAALITLLVGVILIPGGIRTPIGAMGCVIAILALCVLVLNGRPSA